MKKNLPLYVTCTVCFSLSASSSGAEPSPADPWRALQTVPRSIPTSGSHPGNVFLKGETARVPLPRGLSGTASEWRVLDDRGKIVAQNALKSAGSASRFLGLGTLGIGWYRVEFLDRSGKLLGFTTAAVLSPPAVPTPQNSPVCIDTAISWFARSDPPRQEKFARLAALCGVNWVRDRLRWHDIEPAPGKFARETTYDTACRIQKRFGLKVLQVFHDTPPWAREEKKAGGRFVRDLRIIHRFSKAMARRFKGCVQAWEPWNEANIEHFGGHTVDEMCSYQKAAYLGFKAADPGVTVGWNAYTAHPTRLHTRGVLKNEAWPYFDTYNIHSYDRPDSYLDLWAPCREAACGRPMWVTESDRGMKYESGPPWFELSRKGEILKAHFMAQSYASSLFAGAHRHFHFILGHYTEPWNKVQFGLLRLDFTPRPSYVALAAVGRFLAGAKCLGRFHIEGEADAHVIAFRSFPDGEEKDVLVAWAEGPFEWPERGKKKIPWRAPPDLKVEEVFDYLGRSKGDRIPSVLESAPVFILLPPGESRKLDLEKPPGSRWRPGTPSPVVLQLQLPRTLIKKVEVEKWAGVHEYIVDPEKEIELRFFAYNFSPHRVKGAVVLEHLPRAWRLTPREWKIEIASMDRAEFRAVLKRSAASADRNADVWILLRGKFPGAGKPVLAFRLPARAGEGYDR